MNQEKGLLLNFSVISPHDLKEKAQKKRKKKALDSIPNIDKQDRREVSRTFRI
jgi:hypothetical protein